MPMERTQLPQPDVRPIGPEAYLLADPYTYTWRVRSGQGHVQRITVPAGFVYDGASVPRAMWTLTGIRPDGLIRAGALIHDYLYVHRGNLPPGVWQWKNDREWHDAQGHWPRKAADKLFARILREAGVGKFRRRMAYRAVRTFGGRGVWGGY